MTRIIRRLVDLLLGPQTPPSDEPGSPDVWLAALRIGG